MYDERTADELADEGFLFFGELCTQVAKLASSHRRYVKDVLPTPMAKVRVLMAFEGKVVLPNGFKQKYMYHPETVPFFAAYMRWYRSSRLKGRVTAPMISRFYRHYLDGDHEAMRFVPQQDQSRSSRLGSEVVSLARKQRSAS